MTISEAQGTGQSALGCVREFANYDHNKNLVPGETLTLKYNFYYQFGNPANQEITFIEISYDRTNKEFCGTEPVTTKAVTTSTTMEQTTPEEVAATQQTTTRETVTTVQVLTSVTTSPITAAEEQTTTATSTKHISTRE